MKIIKNLSLLVFLILQVSVFAKLSDYKSVSKDFHIRVLLERNVKTVTVSGTDLYRHLHPVNQSKTFAGRKKITFNCNDIKTTFKFDKPVLLATISSSTGLVTIGKNKYHGNIMIATSEGSESCDVINEIDMDVYIGSLLSREMNASWPLEALKAQAIAARTYAMYQITKAKLHDHLMYDIENSEKHQVNGDFFDVTKRTLQAARETSGMLLTNDFGEIIPAFFHASCGGSTLEPQEVWSNSVRGYKEADCEYCKTRSNWSNQLTKERVVSFIEWLEEKSFISKIDKVENVVIYPDKKEKKEVLLSVGKRKISVKKSLFRRYFGRVMFPSNNFYLMSGPVESEVSFVGKGNGHGVGLCQVGAKFMADKGMDYRAIVSHYFPLMTITKSF